MPGELLKGRVAAVTGGGSGIGRATCRRMAEEGALVAVLDIAPEGARSVAEEVGGMALEVDVSDYPAVAHALGRVTEDLGTLSILHNNAGAGTMSPIHKLDPREWDRIVGVNLTGVFNGIRAAVPLMTGGGSIVSTASISGVRPAGGEAPYASAKAGIVALTATAALEYGPGIRVNAVSPGMILTAMTEPLFEHFPEQDEVMKAKTPLARVGTPEDVADVVVFLCSDLARFITGQNIVVDGGMILHGSGVDTMYAAVTAALGGKWPD
jgi:meso-butanediol dehydrogenase/(S,S)-butanediol dehydrogenase/diacetyl reductase